MAYIRDTIPSKILEKLSCPNDIEFRFTEINSRECNWLLCRTCHPPSQNDEYYLIILIKPLTLTVITKKFFLLEISTQK